MRKQNRLLFLIAALALIAALVSLILLIKSCVGKNAIQAFNEDSGIPLPLGAPEQELGDLSIYERTDGFGCYRLTGDGICYEISGYPDALSAYHTTSVHITDGRYTVYGARVGAPYPADMLTVMRSFGFTPSDGTAQARKFESGRLSVTFTLENATVISITASLRTTNITGVQF